MFFYLNHLNHLNYLNYLNYLTFKLPLNSSEVIFINLTQLNFKVWANLKVN